MNTFEPKVNEVLYLTGEPELCGSVPVSASERLPGGRCRRRGRRGRRGWRGGCCYSDGREEDAQTTSLRRWGPPDTEGRPPRWARDRNRDRAAVRSTHGSAGTNWNQSGPELMKPNHQAGINLSKRTELFTSLPSSSRPGQNRRSPTKKHFPNIIKLRRRTKKIKLSLFLFSDFITKWINSDKKHGATFGKLQTQKWSNNLVYSRERKVHFSKLYFQHNHL